MEWAEMSLCADLILANAQVITFDPARPFAEAVAIVGDKIRSVGQYQEISGLRHSATTVIDCRGLLLIPGLIDAHCHLLATAASLTGLNCSPASIKSIGDLQSALARRAADTGPGNWIRGFGLEPQALAERRYPNRWELDAAAPMHPVRLEHSSGHGTVLNSLALGLAGVDATTPDPPEGVIGRHPTSGEPDGCLFELAGWLGSRLGRSRSTEELAQGIAQLNRKLLAHGITSVHDAGPNNSPAHWRTFQALVNAGQFLPRTLLMAGASHLAEFTAADLDWGAGDDRLRLGHVKIMLTLTTGALHPGLNELKELVSLAARQGFPVAIHAVEAEAVVAAAAAVANLKEPSQIGRVATLSAKLGRSPNPTSLRRQHRIEHCAECPPSLLQPLRNSGAMVVTQPGFIYWRGDGYLERVERNMLPNLYPLATLAGGGVPLAFSSDAPVIDPSPWPALYSALARRTATGRSLPSGANGVQPPSPETIDSGTGKLTFTEALRAYTQGGAIAEGDQVRKGSIKPGMLADLALLNCGLAEAENKLTSAKEVKNIAARLTIIGGQIGWNDGIAG